MVRVTAILSRVPVIKFRKGVGSANAPAAHSSPASPGSAAQAPVRAQPAAAMSSATISDIDLPLRYRRRPISQEEIDYINGGGVV
ncbi:unnamed protein product, partial [Brenthis ino]